MGSEKVITAILALHSLVVTDRVWTKNVCGHCSDPVSGAYVCYPCPTVKALQEALSSESAAV